MVAIFVVAFMVGAIGIAAGEASSAHSLLEFGSNGKRNMLYDARQRPQSVLLHGRLYIVYNGDASATKNGKGNAYPMFISYDPQSREFSEPVRIGPNTHRFREFPRLRIITYKHWIGIPLAILCRTRVTVVDNVQTTVQQDRLRPLPCVVEHIAFSIAAKFQQGVSRGSLAGSYTYCTDHERNHKDRDHCQFESYLTQRVE